MRFATRSKRPRWQEPNDLRFAYLNTSLHRCGPNALTNRVKGIAAICSVSKFVQIHGHLRRPFAGKRKAERLKPLNAARRGTAYLTSDLLRDDQQPLRIGASQRDVPSGHDWSGSDCGRASGWMRRSGTEVRSAIRSCLMLGELLETTAPQHWK